MTLERMVGTAKASAKSRPHTTPRNPSGRLPATSDAKRLLPVA